MPQVGFSTINQWFDYSNIGKYQSMNSRVKIYKDDDSRVTLIAENQNCLHKVLQGTSKW